MVSQAGLNSDVHCGQRVAFKGMLIAHRGQLSFLKISSADDRLSLANGGKVPALYGPSADDNRFQ
jgi:hypothetical protein